MTPMENVRHRSSSATSLRKMRPNPWVWSVVFLILAGPLNLGAWAFGRPLNGNLIVTDYTYMAWIILMPATVIALVMQDIMWRKPVFDVSRLWLSAGAGLVLATIAGPLGFAIAGAVSGEIAWAEVLELFLASLLMGTLFGIVPHFAVTVGVPCAITAVGVGYLCTKTVSTPPVPFTNTTLPKRQKPV